MVDLFCPKKKTRKTKRLVFFSSIGRKVSTDPSRQYPKMLLFYSLLARFYCESPVALYCFEKAVVSTKESDMNSIWKLKIGPIKLPYILIELADDYSHCVVGTSFSSWMCTLST